MDPVMNFAGLPDPAFGDFHFTDSPQSMLPTYGSTSEATVGLDHAFRDSEEQDWGSQEGHLGESDASSVHLEVDVINADVDAEISDFQPGTPSPAQGTGTQQPDTVTSYHITRHLQLARLNAIQPAVPIFQTADSAKQWRKHEQSQGIFDVNDTDFPRSSAEQREYVHLLAIAFKYLGVGCKSTKQEQVFVGRQQTPDGEKEIESWCWMLVGEIMRRQLSGRPSDFTKLKFASLDPNNQTFAQRFSAVYNALKLEKRCCIRFSNMAAWHKRLANNPMAEIAEIRKNDLINHKRAEKIAETKGLAKALK